MRSGIFWGLVEGNSFGIIVKVGYKGFYFIGGRVESCKKKEWI